MTVLHSHWVTTTGHVAGIALLFVAAGMSLGAVIELFDGTEAPAMLVAAAVTAVAGAGLRYATRPGTIDRATVFTAVAGTWLVVSAVGSSRTSWPGRSPDPAWAR